MFQALARLLLVFRGSLLGQLTGLFFCFCFAVQAEYIGQTLQHLYPLIFEGQANPIAIGLQTRNAGLDFVARDIEGLELVLGQKFAFVLGYIGFQQNQQVMVDGQIMFQGFCGTGSGVRMLNFLEFL